MRELWQYALVALLLPASVAAQECSAGNKVGDECGSATFSGCCEGPSKVRWCENDALCEIDCSQNQASTATNNCCQTSDGPGCCDTQLQNCVCNLDSWCCTNYWDSICVGKVEQCGSSCSPMPPCPGPSNVCGWQGTQGYYDCMAVPSADPSGLNPMMCSGCVPDCALKQCGPDGCGSTCGTCPIGSQCDAFGQCQVPCVPDCAGKECGDNGCGGTCGVCSLGEQCGNGLCVATCQADCFGKSCGSDGCGGTCGDCGFDEKCNPAGQCESLCTADCLGKACGGDGCGGTCGSCGLDENCIDGLCVCEPDCFGKECGTDGCGGSCGSCPAGHECSANWLCIDGCEPDCLGKQCGDNGCGGSCGSCGFDQVCEGVVCVDPEPDDTSGTDDTSGPGTDGGSSDPVDTSAGSGDPAGTDEVADPELELPTGGSGGDDGAGSQGDCPPGYVVKLNGKCVKDEATASAFDSTVSSGTGRRRAAGGCTTGAGSATPVALLWLLSLFVILGSRATFRRRAQPRSPCRRP